MTHTNRAALLPPGRFARERKAVLFITADERALLPMAASLEALDWTLYFADSGPQARAVLDSATVPLVFVDADNRSTCWRTLLDQLPTAAAGPAPRFVVLSRLADERLWAEVLNRGGYDLLLKPLNTREAAWVAGAALDEWRHATGATWPAPARESLACSGS